MGEVEVVGQVQSAPAYVGLRAELEAVRVRPAAVLAPGEADEIEAALARLEDGTYGTCVDCGGAIPIERLEVVPTASRCVPCQQRRE
jgi:DnaK suppressor protein